MKRFMPLLFSCLTAWANAQVLHTPHRLAEWGIASANYSGITPLGDGRYAVVSDKEPKDGFYLWQIEQDFENGDILDVRPLGFLGQEPDTTDAQGLSLRDSEGAAFVPHRGTLFISSEGDQEISEWTLEGERTGRSLNVPDLLGKTYRNYGFEALAYDTLRHTFYTITENSLPLDGKPSKEGTDSTTLLRLQAFDDSLQATLQWAYLLDAPQCGVKGRSYAHGVVAMTALADGSLAVLEREAHITQDYNKSRVWNRLYLVQPLESRPITMLTPTAEARSRAIEKLLLTQWSTRFALFGDTWANYEGMCLGQPTADGRQTLLLVSDSQGGFGIGPFRLKDWIRVIVLPSPAT